jgi:hypothetical protein
MLHRSRGATLQPSCRDAQNAPQSSSQGGQVWEHVVLPLDAA